MYFLSPLISHSSKISQSQRASAFFFLLTIIAVFFCQLPRHVMVHVTYHLCIKVLKKKSELKVYNMHSVFQTSETYC